MISQDVWSAGYSFTMESQLCFDKYNTVTSTSQHTTMVSHCQVFHRKLNQTMCTLTTFIIPNVATMRTDFPVSELYTVLTTGSNKLDQSIIDNKFKYQTLSSLFIQNKVASICKCLQKKYSYSHFSRTYYLSIQTASYLASGNV